MLTPAAPSCLDLPERLDLSALGTLRASLTARVESLHQLLDRLDVAYAEGLEAQDRARAVEFAAIEAAISGTIRMGDADPARRAYQARARESRELADRRHAALRELDLARDAVAALDAVIASRGTGEESRS